MTEKEKMLIGNCYNSRDPELLEDYHSARLLLKAYNNLESTSNKRSNILTHLLGCYSPGVWIEAPFFCDYGYNISLGENTFINMNCVFLDCNRITIGENGLIGPHVQIYTVNHPLNAEKRIHDEGYVTFSQPINIGDNAWIGGNTVICPGVTIGNNVTIGSGSVVTKNLPDNVLAFGNPCKVQKSI